MTPPRLHSGSKTYPIGVSPSRLTRSLLSPPTVTELTVAAISLRITPRKLLPKRSSHHATLWSVLSGRAKTLGGSLNRFGNSAPCPARPTCLKSVKARRCTRTALKTGAFSDLIGMLRSSCLASWTLADPPPCAASPNVLYQKPRGWRGQVPRQPGQVRKEAATTSPTWVDVQPLTSRKFAPRR